MIARGSRIPAALVVIVLIAAILGAQAVGFSAAQHSGRTPGQLLGRTGFAYLGGLRAFAAAVIWNRIDPQHDMYFSGVPLQQQTFMVPKLRLVTVLDPSFTEAYYISSFIVFQRVGAEEGIAIAREGLAKNPQSGLLMANLAQLLFLQDKESNRVEALALFRDMLRDEVQWANDDEQFEGYAMASQSFDAYGETGIAGTIRQLLGAWKAQGVGAGDHDHNGDGKQDH